MRPDCNRPQSDRWFARRFEHSSRRSSRNNFVALLLLGCSLVCGQVQAGLFNDDEARKQIQLLEVRVGTLEESGKKQEETNTQQAETNKQQTRTMLDMQSQIESLNTELRNLRGQNEELAHKLLDADKRQNDYYQDLNSRVQRFETTEATTFSPQTGTDGAAQTADDPAAANRAYEVAHGLFKAGKHQDSINAFQNFLKKFPDSVYIPSAHYEMGVSYFILNNYQDALVSYQLLATKYSYTPKAAEAMLGIADCQQGLKDTAAVKKTLKQLITKYPDSEAAAEAKKRLSAAK